MSWEPGTVGAVFEKPHGRLQLDRHGRWWVTRTELALDTYDEVTVQVADGKHIAEITGTPEQLRSLAHAIAAHVDSALANTPGEHEAGLACPPASRTETR